MGERMDNESRIERCVLGLDALSDMMINGEHQEVRPQGVACLLDLIREELSRTLPKPVPASCNDLI